MKRKNMARNALITSVLSLLLCVSMLVGTTFAWFTDEVVSGNNKIIAGTLDVELLMYQNGEYVDISDENKPLFGENALVNNTLWEPGKTEIVYLAVANHGNLALKYQIELSGVTGLLAEAMEFAVIDRHAENPITSWADVKAAAPTGQFGDVYQTKVMATGAIVPGDSAVDYIVLAIHMKEEAGNIYQGQEFQMDISVMATQYEYESDAFGNTYDAEATYSYASTASELVAAVANSGVVALSSDIELGEATIAIPAGVSVTLDLNGKKITATPPTKGYAISVKGSLTLKNGTLEVDTTDRKNIMGIVSSGNGDSSNVLVLEDMVVSGAHGGIYHNGTNYGVNVTVKDSKIECTDVGIFLSGSESWTELNQLNIVNSSIRGETAVEAKHADISVTNSTLEATTNEVIVRDYNNGNCTAGFAVALTNNDRNTTRGSINLYDENNIIGNIWVKDDGDAHVTTNASNVIYGNKDNVNLPLS